MLDYCSTLRRLALMAVFVFVPGFCAAQSPLGAGTFGDLPGKVRIGNVVIVTDTAGRQVRGKVAEVSSVSLVILTRDQNRTWANRQSFTPPDVREIKRTGSLWNGLLIGFGAGAIPGLLVEDCTGCASAGEVAMLFGGIGAGIGLGIDAAFGPKRVYRAPAAGRSAVTFVPVLGATRKGALLAVRF